MSDQASDQTSAAVVRTISVNASRERAFAVFTEQLGSSWPKSYSIGGVEMTHILGQLAKQLARAT